MTGVSPAQELLASYRDVQEQLAKYACRCICSKTRSNFSSHGASISNTRQTSRAISALMSSYSSINIPCRSC